MPLSWGISHPARSIRVVAKDRIKHIELMNLMNAIDAAGANSYRKLVDFGRLVLASQRRRWKSSRVWCVTGKGPEGVVFSKASLRYQLLYAVDSTIGPRPDVYAYDVPHLEIGACAVL
jgi:hypothetical protein